MEILTFLCRRFRVCQIIAKLLNIAVDTHRHVSAQRLDKIQNVMLQRLRDKVDLLLFVHIRCWS